MKIVKPKVYIIAATQIEEGLLSYLRDEGIAWRPEATNTSAETLCEVEGRLCYRSWADQDGNFTNKNISKVREGNKNYISNILKSGHGSVLEHSHVSFLIKDLSRIASHELVRHRAGCAYSQESGRYIRENELNLYIPDIILNNQDAMEVVSDLSNTIEASYKKLEGIYDIDNIPDFSTKKILTSAFRRINPNGSTSTIGMTANHRAIRHMIALRSSLHAESEIREIFDAIATMMKDKFPNIYQDMTKNEDGEWIFDNPKV